MTVDAPRLAVPRAWQDENADAYWSEGHVDPTLFLVACLVDVAENCEPSELMEFLGGPHERPWRAQWAERCETVVDWIDDVEHVWCRDPHGDGEYFERCKASDNGALPFTRKTL